MHEDKERDDALIAEKKRLADILEKKAGNAYYAITSVDLRQAAALLRGDEQPKPDRAEVLADELLQSPKYWPGYAAIIRRHFDELRAEWEAERPVIEVPIQVKAWAEGIGSVIPPTDEVREWIKSLPIGATVRPAVPVFSEEVIKQMVTRFLGWKLPDDFHPDDGITQAEAMVRYILDGAKGGAATSIDVHQRRGIMATCITLALRDYDEWQKDDDYNFIAALERVINHLEPAREVALQEFSQ